MVVVVMPMASVKLAKAVLAVCYGSCRCRVFGVCNIDYLDAVVGVRGYQGVRGGADGGIGDAVGPIKLGKTVMVVSYSSCRCRVFGVCDIDYLDTVVDVRCYQGRTWRGRWW